MQKFTTSHIAGMGAGWSRQWGAKLAAGIAFVSTFFLATVCAAQAPTPEVLFYRFNESGTTVTNLASSPPSNTATASILGAQTQGGTITGTYLSALVGSQNSSSTDYVNTGWATSLTGSWSISFFTGDIQPSSTLFYIMGDANATSLRVFTNGVAGPDNWILRGPINDISIPGGAVMATTMNTFVYDSVASQIRAYRDGVLVSTVAQSPPTISSPGPFKVGGYSTNVGLNSGGKLGDFRIYSHALTQTEITAIYDAAFVPIPVPPAIPTLSEWAMILLGLVVAAFGIWTVQSRTRPVLTA